MVLESLKFLSQKTTYAYKVSAFTMEILTKCQYLVGKNGHSVSILRKSSPIPRKLVPILPVMS